MKDMFLMYCCESFGDLAYPLKPSLKAWIVVPEVFAYIRRVHAQGADRLW